MSYEFPKRRLGVSEVLHPDDLTEDIAVPAELLSGRLNAQNVKKSIDLNLAQREKGAYHTLEYTYNVGDPAIWSGVPETYSDLTTGRYIGAPGSSPMFDFLPNGPSWSTLTSKTFTANSPTSLWINAFCQYLWWGMAGNDGADQHIPGHAYCNGNQIQDYFPFSWQHALNVDDKYRVYGAGFQAAIRVNGRVLEWSVTGAQETGQSATVPLKPAVQRDRETQFPGPGLMRSYDLSSCGPVASPIRIGAVVEVPPGQVTVELVARRERSDRYTRDWGGREDGDKLLMFSRQLLVLETPSYPGPAMDGHSVVVPAIKEEDILSHGALYTNRLQVVESAAENIVPGSFAPSTFRHEHLKSPVRQVSTHYIAPDDYTEFRTIRPESAKAARRRQVYNDGITSPTTHLTDDYNNDQRVGWAMVADRSAAVVAPLTSGHWKSGEHPTRSANVLSLHSEEPKGFLSSDDSEESTLIVFADVECRAVIPPGLHKNPPWNYLLSVQAHGFFRIGAHFKGDRDKRWYLFARSEGFVMHQNFWGRHEYDHESEGRHAPNSAIFDPFQVDDCQNIPLMLTVKSEKLMEGRVIDGLAVFTSGFFNGLRTGPAVRLKRGRISAITIRD